MMKKHGWWIITLAVIAVFVAVLITLAHRPGKQDAFAQCIEKSGAKFYGAWWCPHCQAQKAVFGRSAKYLPYVECQTRSREMTQECIDADIKSFPTWIFADGSRVSGEQSFEALSAKTNCEVAPQ